MSTDSTPSIGDYLDAAASAYSRKLAAPLTRFEIDGAPAWATNTENGFHAEAFKDRYGNVIISYEGTQKPADPSGFDFSVGAIKADAQLVSGEIPQAFMYADSFALKVIEAAGKQGIPRSKIFVTGHSLGGAEAEAVAAIERLSGATFGAPGISPLVGSLGARASSGLVNYVEFGDAIGNFGNDTLAGQSYSTTSAHVGQIKMVGDQSAGLALQAEAKIFRASVDTVSKTALFEGSTSQYALAAFIRSTHIAGSWQQT